jgi:hypothetical protein
VQLQFSHPNFFRNLPELTQTETDIVNQSLSHPAVIKYLNLVAFNSMVEESLSPAIEATQNVNAMIARMSFNKGVISVVDTILSNLTPMKEI